ncbi:phosphoenolpyruvate synthase [Ferroplasma acidiphilum]|uniref:phosphoenolpyruvate synthase n=1 Tax=Ferroplasma acidiphilum TaxID=74969 RepID=UPI002814C9AE|nr:phosphoenolpyruvate synthase [Ferroplasma acidiphilum]WMT54046.1 MAG: phosphoenolpyruvate synthase [Ferroplasma acidiphilum]
MTDRTSARILWFSEISKEDLPLVGGKSANLGEMVRMKTVPVPNGFSTTSYAYKEFITENDLDDKIINIIKHTDIENSTKLKEASEEIRQLFLNAHFNASLGKEIREYYRKLIEKEKNVYVAVRSSATSEDLPDASFAGEQDTYLNIHGEDDVVQNIKACYASLFSPRAIYYREKKNFGHFNIYLAVAVQKQLFSEVSGVMFTVDVSTGDNSKIIIESSYGLGEYIVGGVVTPDTYYVDKSTMKITNKIITNKNKMLKCLETGGTEELVVEKEMANKQSLSDEEVIHLANYGLQLEKHYGNSMDVEWAKDSFDHKIYILQARFETVWNGNRIGEDKMQQEKEANENEVILKGLPASPGKVAGVAKVLLSVDEMDKFKEGDILVTKMTAPDWVPIMGKAKAIVTDEGGLTCHAAIISRELGVPCIVGTSSYGKKATEVLKDGETITIDAKNGLIYLGGITTGTEEKTPEQNVSYESDIITGTKVLVNMGEPQLSEKVSKLPSDGIGLMREEFIWAEIGEHPLSLIKNGRGEYFVDRLSSELAKVCRDFAPRPVVLRFSDFKSDEYKSLKGGKEFEPEEDNPLLGWRGASRYYDDRYKEAFKLELQGIKKARDEYLLKNLWVMIPFTRTVEELKRVVKIMEDNGLERTKDFKLFLMAEIPSNILLADKFNQYVDGYSIGSNDLTMLLLGSDRNNGKMSSMFDERDLAIKRAIRYLIKIAHRDGKIVSICGQAPSQYDEIVDFLVRSGIDDISVNPDAVTHVRKMVASVEKRIQLEAALGKVYSDPDWDLP